MTKLVTFLGRKTTSAAETPATAPQPALVREPVKVVAEKPAQEKAAPDKADIELDQDLFFPIATQLGQENESVRNLLIDAEHKIGELEIIKRSIGKLVDPVSKTLRAYEETKSEKLSLQSVLNNTRLAHNKLRSEFAASEKKAITLEAECTRLKDMVSVAQQSVAALERTKAEQLAELAARRTHIAELQHHAQQQAADLQLTRDENRRLSDRVVSADKRTVQLEGQVQAAAQKSMQAEQERIALQASLDRAHADLAQTARRLSESDKSLATAQFRLKAMESGLAEAQSERLRLSAALDEANQKHTDEMNLQNSRFDAVQARAAMTDSLLEEARQTLMARAEEIQAYERRVSETSTAHEGIGERLDQVTALLAERESQIRKLEQAHAAIAEQNRMLTNAVAARENAHNYAQQRIKEQTDLAQLLESQLHAARDANELQIQQLEAQLQRERLERSMAEGALESGRKDVARLLRELGNLQYHPLPATAGEADIAPASLRSAA